MKTRILLLMTVIFLISTIQAQIINVPGDYNTIQEGINAAADGDTLLVAENTYYENIKFMGKAITVASEYIMDNDSLHIVNTIIDGSQAANPDSAAAVMFVDGEDTTSILNGFTITGGSGVMFMNYAVRAGGGIFSYNSGCKIINNIITENHVEDDDKAGAAGIGCMQDQGDHWVTVRDNYIGYNTALAGGLTAFGGGLAIMTDCVIENNLIEHNTCTNTNGATDGGGIELEAASGVNPVAYVNTHIIQYNELNGATSAAGAGIIFNGFIPVIMENVISGNSAFAQTIAVGGGIHIIDSPYAVEIANNVIKNNSLEGSNGAFGGGVRLVNISENVNIVNNLISANTLDAGSNAWGGGIGAATADNINIINNTIENNICNSNSQQSGGAGVNLLMCGNTFIEYNEINENAITTGTYAWGGGILIDKATSNVDINNNIINNNTSEGIGRGGGICIYNNSDDAFYNINSNKILNNYSDSWGGGICARNAYRIFIINNIFKENECEYLGGAIEFYETPRRISRDDLFDPLIANNNFISNTSSTGGAIYSGYDNDVPIIFNSIFLDNSASTGQNLYNISDMDMFVYNNVIDTTEIYTPWSGENNMNEDP